ncbi:MAG: hypothetical protein NW226_26575 [Microscillaceae bacterium]|nr:hypothetical protein [Microscillaceae bacterium]
MNACHEVQDPQPDIELTKEDLEPSSSPKSLNVPSPTDTVEYPTILGARLPNPYLLANMRQAYTNVKGGNWSSLAASHKYVRFRPSTLDQLATLEESLDLELFDEPLDYQIIQEGDYYQDPSIPDEQITWQYAVVPASFSFPSGIVYETLASIHIPDDTNIEAEAERLAGLNADGDGLASASASSGIKGGVITNIVSCPPGYCPDPATGLTTCRLCTTPTPQPGATPQGRIMVNDINARVQVGIVGVRRVRVVARRWFKVERTFTDINGNFTINKRFRNKVKLLVKFKNEHAIIRGVRGIRLWQMFFPVKFRVGTFSGNQINTVQSTFLRNDVINSRGTRNWVAATALNTLQNFKTLATEQGTGTINWRLKIMLSNWGFVGRASAPLFAKRLVNDLPEVLVRSTLVASFSYITAGISLFYETLKRQIDVAYSYNVVNINDLNSDRVVETLFHEFSHATHYNQNGNTWYANFVDAIVAESLANSGNDDFNAYGQGNTANSPIIAVGESWAYHYGRFLADQRYGVMSSCITAQEGGPVFCGAARPYTAVLEAFNPNLLTDPYRWIPDGLYWDLNDNTPGEAVAGIGGFDQVSGYTNRQMFAAFSTNIRSLQQYRDRLLQLNNNNQLTQVNTLFQFYGY